MNLTVRLREEAEQDIEAASWYERQKLGLGHDFLDSLSLLLHSLPEQPLQYQIIYKNFRRALLHRFPFGVYYSIDGDSIIVYAVMHASRDRKRWQGRT